MNKKGFTLVELLGVIIIISIIIALVFPEVTKVVQKSKQIVNDIQINKILDATYDFTLKNIGLLPNDGEVKYITLNELKKEHLIDVNIRDSKTNEKFTDDLVISIKNKNYATPKTKYSKLNGNYLYTAEFEFMNSDTYNTNRPIISFEGHEERPIVVNLNIGDIYSPIKYTAKSIKDIDLTNQVIENIVYNSKSINNIDTSKAGVYYVNYSVVDSNGYSCLETVNIIVSDNEKPSLTIPDNTTISIDISSYDLMDGVSCEDNSGACDIKINGDIIYGVSGKYIIEYIATDPSGNTSILKRIITVQ